jgi:hypothetical protein
VNNRAAGTYTVDVRAINNGSNQVGQIASDSVGVSDPPLPPTSVVLSKGGSAAGESGCTSGRCWYYHVEVYDFSEGGTFPLRLYCNGGLLRSTSISIGANGRGTFDSQNSTGSYCGYPGVWVAIDAANWTYQSARQDWN